jgi:RNA polymerase sigma factor (sigma-70 family)
MIDPQEKTRLFEETIGRKNGWISRLARKNAPINSCEDLEQEIRLAFWRLLDSYDGKISCLRTSFTSVACITALNFKYRNIRRQKREESYYSNSIYVVQERDQTSIIEEFTGKLGKLDRQIFTMYLKICGYAEMSALLGLNEVSLRKRMSRIRQKFKEFISITIMQFG